MNREFDKRMQKKLNELKKSKTPEPIRSYGDGALDLGLEMLHVIKKIQIY